MVTQYRWIHEAHGRLHWRRRPPSSSIADKPVLQVSVEGENR
jgi:hypothetical protein